MRWQGTGPTHHARKAAPKTREDGPRPAAGGRAGTAEQTTDTRLAHLDRKHLEQQQRRIQQQQKQHKVILVLLVLFLVQRARRRVQERGRKRPHARTRTRTGTRTRTHAPGVLHVAVQEEKGRREVLLRQGVRVEQPCVRVASQRRPWIRRRTYVRKETRQTQRGAVVVVDHAYAWRGLVLWLTIAALSIWTKSSRNSVRSHPSTISLLLAVCVLRLTTMARFLLVSVQGWVLFLRIVLLKGAVLTVHVLHAVSVLLLHTVLFKSVSYTTRTSYLP